MNPGIKLHLLVTIALLSGCAAGKPTAKSVIQATGTDKKVVSLECKAAHEHGCRYKGRFFPWNAWADVMGYDSHHYTVLAVAHNGPRAVVSVAER